MKKKKVPPKVAAAKKQVRRQFQGHRMTQPVLHSLLGEVCEALGVAPGETRHSARAHKSVRNVGGFTFRRTKAERADRSWLLIKIGPRDKERVLNLDGLPVGAQSMGAMLTGILEGIRLSAGKEA